jgi:hypothetical protein
MKMTKKAIIITVIIAVAVIGGVIGVIIALNSGGDDVVDVIADDGNTNEPPQTEDEYYTDEPTNIEVFHYEFRENVAVINQAPTYSIIEEADTFIITVQNATDEIKSLSVGDTFAFEPTTQNPSGVAGHIINTADEGEVFVITARIPQSLEEIFEEFELVGDINILADATDIHISEELQGIEGIEIIRNPTRLVEMGFDNIEIGGIRLDGKVSVHAPILMLTIRSLSEMEMTINMSAGMNIKASSEYSIDKIIPLFTIYSTFFGITPSIEFGLRINAEGQGHLELSYGITVRFGLSTDSDFTRVDKNHTLDYYYN